MTVQKILRYGDQQLLETSVEVTQFNTPELHQLISDMRETMHAKRYPDVEPVPETILINPEIKVLGQGADGMWEGCLSIPGMKGYVERPNHIRYSAFDVQGNHFTREVTGFHATVVQHECDHLDGVLYPMRMNDLSRFGFIDELKMS